MRFVFRITLSALLLSITISSAGGILKQILGAALMGDVIPSLYSLQCVSTINNFTNFLLYTRSHPDDPGVLIPNNWKSLQESDYDPSVPTKIIVHGFVDNMRLSDWMTRMKNALLREGDYNVIVTDWSCGNSFPYKQAVANSKKTAHKMGDLVLFLKETRGADPVNFHIIGHSLGSHIAGLVGYRLRTLGRITALDPAGPKFYDVPLEQKLDPSDASFVDVIHTDGGNGLFEGLGLKHRVGHIDFYPNGGSRQPGCHSSPFTLLPRIGIQRAARYYLTCDHYRSVDFYIESISSTKVSPDAFCQYTGVQCRDWQLFSEGRCADCSHPGSCALMGYYSDVYPFRNSDDAAREFFVKTSQAEPYCVHQYQVVLETGDVASASRGTFESPINTGIVHLEISTESGKVSFVNLNENDKERLKPRKRYVYLATSKFPFGQVKTANLWLGDEQRPLPTSPHQPLGFRIQKIEILPIAFEHTDTEESSELQARSLTNRKMILCGYRNSTLSKNSLYRLSSSNC